MFDRILVPVEGSEASLEVLWQARRIAAPGAKIVLVRVVSERELATAPGARDTVADARRELLSRAGFLRPQGFQVGVEVLLGEATERILSFAETWRPSLIALATRPAGLLDRLLGSSWKHLVRASPFPLLIVGPQASATGATGGFRRFERILVPLDTSEEADGILPLVAEIAGRDSSEVVLFHAIHPVCIASGSPIPSCVLPLGPEEAEALLERRRAGLRGIRTRTLVTIGIPPAAILDAAEEQAVDLVAMSTHGLSGFARWLHGSNAEPVLDRSRRPLLLQHVALAPAAVAAAGHSSRLRAVGARR